MIFFLDILCFVTLSHRIFLRFLSPSLVRKIIKRENYVAPNIADRMDGKEEKNPSLNSDILVPVQWSDIL